MPITLKIWIYAVKIIDGSLKNNTNVIFELVDFSQSLKLKYVIKFQKRKIHLKQHFKKKKLYS